MTTQLDLADAQFIGFAEGRFSGNIIRLIESMGLTKSEWDKWKKKYSNVLLDSDFNDIENYYQNQ